MNITLPTAVTLLRIVLIPLFVVVYYMPFTWVNTGAAVIFFVICASDWVDGYLARSMQQETRFGAFLDPVADKLSIVVVIIAIVSMHPSIVVALPAMIIVAREITISALREWMAELGSRTTVQVSSMGKTKTFAQMWALGFMIYHDSLFDIPIFTLGLAIFYLAAILTIVSMVIYLRAAWPVIAGKG